MIFNYNLFFNRILKINKLINDLNKNSVLFIKNCWIKYNVTIILNILSLHIYSI